MTLIPGELIGIVEEDSNRWGLGVEGMVSPAEPLVDIKLGNDVVKFLVDRGATYSVLNSCKGPMNEYSTAVVGAMGNWEVRPFFQPIKCKIGNKMFVHEFLYMPECPIPLMGRDLLNKLGAQVTFDANKIRIHILQNNAWEAQIYVLQELSETMEDKRGTKQLVPTDTGCYNPFCTGN